MARAVAASALFVIACLAVAPVRGAWADPAPGNESDLYARIDAARAGAGLPDYTWRDDLAEVARRQAQRMADQQRLFHNPNLQTEVTDWRIVGENVGRAGSTAEVHDAFMASDTHRREILSPDLTEVGVGVVAVDGEVWVSEVFRLPQPAATAAPEPAAPRAPKPAAAGPPGRDAPPPASPAPPVVVPASAAPEPAPEAPPPIDLPDLRALDALTTPGPAPGAPAVLGKTIAASAAVPMPVPRIPAPLAALAAGLSLLMTWATTGEVVKRVLAARSPAAIGGRPR